MPRQCDAEINVAIAGYKREHVFSAYLTTTGMLRYRLCPIVCGPNRFHNLRDNLKERLEKAPERPRD